MAGETDVARPAELAKAHPEVAERYERLSALFFEAREARRPLADAARAEAQELLRWADALAAEYLGEPGARQTLVDRDDAAFALALRLKDDALVVRQVLQAADELRLIL